MNLNGGRPDIVNGKDDAKAKSIYQLNVLLVLGCEAGVDTNQDTRMQPSLGDVEA